MKEFLYLLLIPGVTQKLDLQRFGEWRLLEYNFLELSNAILYYSFNIESEMDSLKDNVCSFFDPYALLLCSKKGNYGFQHHLANPDWNLTSPRGIITPQQKKRKHPKPIICVDPKAFINVFPMADSKVLEMYLRPGVEGRETLSFYEEYSEQLFSRDGKWYVRKQDRYPVGNPLQAFDFLQYLGYDLPNSIIQSLSV